jgi:hypothetical protein
MKKQNPQSKIPSRGVLLIALGSAHYGRMAANAAASIRFCDKYIPIHLVYSHNSLSHLTPEHRSLFTSMAECPPEFMEQNGQQCFIKAKTCLYELSPFTETLFMDVDLLWFGAPVSKLMDDLSPVDFTTQSRGCYDYATGIGTKGYTSWCSEHEAQQAYKLSGKIYRLSSEVVWFRKNKQTKKLFKLVREVFDKPKVRPSFEFRGNLPDELAYNIATAKLQMYPRKENEVFIYWELMDKKVAGTWSEVIKKYYGYSMGGNNVHPFVRERYEQMAKAHAQALRLPYHFKLFPKKQWDKLRAVI